MSFDRDNRSDAEFERSLLESARKDGPAHSAQDAWARFAGGLSLIVPSPSPGGGGPQAVAKPTGATTMAKTAVRGVVMKWLFLGAIGGSAVTAAVVQHRERTPNAPAVERLSAIPRQTADEARVPLPVGEPVTTLQPRTATPVPLARRPGPARTRPQPHQPGAERVSEPLTAENETPAHAVVEPSSTLAAEVARIDAARSASANGKHDEAIRLIERFHRDFPEGALAPDADVVALEAAAAKHDRAEVERRAARFLSQYPGDPHAARVQGLAEP